MAPRSHPCCCTGRPAAGLSAHGGCNPAPLPSTSRFCPSRFCCMQTGERRLSFRAPEPPGGGSNGTSTSTSTSSAVVGGAAQGHPTPPAASQASTSKQHGLATTAPRAPAAPVGNSQGSHCTCLCADTMPVVAGLADGSLCLWWWRRREAAAAPVPAAAAAEMRRGAAGALAQAASAPVPAAAQHRSAARAREAAPAPAAFR